MWKYVLPVAIVLVASVVWAANRKAQVSHTERDIWAITTQDATSGTSLDTVNIVRIIDEEQSVVCYLVLDVAAPSQIYCMRSH